MNLPLVKMAFVYVFVFFFQTSVKAQPDYTFKNAVLVSGNGLQTGTKYKFSNVKTGVDALVTVIAQTGGISLKDIDNNTTGFDEAFQPTISVEKKSSGYVEFKIDFVDAGTGSPTLQNFVPVTSLNVTGATFGDGVLNEQDMVQFFPGYYDYSITGTKLYVNLPEGWVAIRNMSGLRSSVIDTVAKDVMATVVNKNISGFLLRVGGTNSSSTNAEVRMRSVYFKSFGYGHMNTLPNRTMLRLSGARKQNFVELKGTLSASHSYNRMIIERAVSSNVFGIIENLDISGKASAEFNFTFLDTKPENGINYYRIRLVSTSTNIQEISNTLMVKMDMNQKSIAFINTVLQVGNPVLTIFSPEDNDAELQVADMSGRIFNHTKAKLNNGFNNMNLAGLNTAKGIFVVVVKTKNTTTSQRILVQ